MRRLFFPGVVVLLLSSVAGAGTVKTLNCGDNGPLCTEPYRNLSYEGKYTGHDEPSLLFYSNVPGSGNSNVYRLKIPTEPPTLPNQNGTGGTFNFQLHVAFWFGMALCDNQSAPNPSSTACVPNSDTNIFDSPNPLAADYIGKHPGTAFLELQFYPPGWVLWPPGASCDATRWCAALTIDSLSENMNTGQVNNGSCLATAGVEPVNFAFITKNGVPLGPPGPLTQTLATFTPDPNQVLMMNPGDDIVVTINDTASGLKVLIQDLTTGQSGSMVASSVNGFAQVLFQPAADSCSQSPYNFHPMYSTSSEHTRVPWAAHSFNVAFSDEIGHFEYCLDAACSVPQDADDDFCFPGSDSSLIKVGGCYGTDFDFDGVGYKLTWPGTFNAFGQDKKVHPSPIMFTSPKFVPTGGGNREDYSRVAFEADLPAIEFATNPPCNRTTGANCVNPPVGANFYPIFTTTGNQKACFWQFGGANLPSTKDTFGGNSTAEFGPLLQLFYAAPGPSVIYRYIDFRQVLSFNPCENEKDFK